MSPLTDPTTLTPPGEWIDTGPLRHRLEVKRLLAYFTAETLLEMADRSEDISGALDQLRVDVAAAEDARIAWEAAVDHNSRRLLTAQEGIAEARQELTKAVARSNGYATADEAAEAAGRDQQHREQDGF